ACPAVGRWPSARSFCPTTKRFRLRTRSPRDRHRKNPCKHSRRNGGRGALDQHCGTSRFGPSGYTRPDFILDISKRLWIVETNNLPGMTSASLIPQSAVATRMGFDELWARCHPLVLRFL